MLLSQWGDEIHIAPQGLKGTICVMETLLAKAGQAYDPIILHPCPCPAFTAFSNPYIPLPPIRIFLKRLICDCHTPLSISIVSTTSLVRPWNYPWKNYRSPQDIIIIPDIILALSTFYPPLPNGVLASKVSMQDLQEGLAPPDHCRQTIGKKGRIFPPAGSALVKTGERGKGKCDLHGAISDCPSWESKFECFAKQAFTLTSSIYGLYHIGLY